MDKTNTMIKPSKGYIQIAQPKRPQKKFQYYRNFQELNTTPLKLLQEKARRSSQLGSSIGEVVSKTIIPLDKAERRKFSSKISTFLDINTEKQILQPLKIQRVKENPKTKQAVEQASVGEVQLRNRFDNPLTQREIEQLTIKKLQSTGIKEIHEALKKVVQLGNSIKEKLNKEPTFQQPEQPKEEYIIKKENGKVEEIQSDLERLKNLPEEKEERRLVLGEIKEKYQLPKYFKVAQVIDAIQHL